MDTSYIVFPQIDPVAIDFGLFQLRWYGLTYLFGIMFAYWLAKKRAANNGEWTDKQIEDLIFYGFLGVVIGGRLGYVLFYQFDYFLENPSYLFKTSQGGMSFHGGLLGVIGAMFLIARKFNKTFIQVADFVAPLVPVGLASGRIGNFINSELWGRVTDVPWAVLFPNGGPLPRHPSQLYEFALEGVALFIILYFVSLKKRKEGTIAGLFLVGYGCFRTFVELFREPDAHLGFLAFDLTMGQILSIPMVLLGMWLIFGFKRGQS